jgi:hypothetical protein
MDRLLCCTGLGCTQNQVQETFRYKLHLMSLRSGQIPEKKQDERVDVILADSD